MAYITSKCTVVKTAWANDVGLHCGKQWCQRSCGDHLKSYLEDNYHEDRGVLAASEDLLQL